VQWQIFTSFPRESLSVLGVNNTSSKTWLRTYRTQSGVAFPLVYDDSSALFHTYQVGAAFGNQPPTFIIVDGKGVVRYRIDNVFKHTEEIWNKIRELLSNPP
jgi:peroxiredoxin